MKPKSFKTILALALLAPGALFAQTTATTTPVGYVTVGVGGVPAASDVILSAPLDNPTAAAAVIAGITAPNQIDLQGTPGYTVNQWTAVPHIVKITSGAKAGFYAVITANDADTFTVTLPSGQNLTGVLSGDKIEVQEAWTASAFFSGTTIPADTELYQFGGTTGGINIAADFLYIWDGTDWLDGVSGEPTDPIIYPGEAFILRNVGATEIDEIVVSGQVPMSGFTNVVSNIDPGQQDLPFGIASPIDQTLAQSGLTAIAEPDDEINFYDNSLTGINKAPTSSIVFDGADWLDTISGEPISPTFTVKAGEGFIYRRASSSPTVNWTILPSYLP